MTKKLKLDYTPDFDFIIIAIVSVEKDYKLIWDINTNLDFDFVRVNDYTVYNKKSKSDQAFSCFVSEQHCEYLDLKIISNKSLTGYLLDEIKNIDFLLMINGEYENDLAKKTQTLLNKLASVQSAFILDINRIKGKDRLLSY